MNLRCNICTYSQNYISSSHFLKKLHGTSFQTLTPLYLRDLCKRLGQYLGKYNILLSDDWVTWK